MTTHPTSNKQIVKNTLFLYIRMLISLMVSLYTSRVILDVLGIEDYGIYSVVGGVVIMFSFLNVSMSGATSRFLAYEIGRNDQIKLEKVFSNAFAAHLIIAVIIALLLETVGLWLLYEKLVIDKERMFAASVVYQLSVLSTLVGFTQVPYNASIIAHERFNVYAYVELINVFLKLVIVYMLSIGNYDKLILYAVLVFIVSFTIMLIYRFYCWKHFSECRQWPKIDSEIFNPMIKYAAWSVYGDGCYSLRQQGTNIILNIFFGTVVNAANGIATTVLSAVSGFATNIISAFRPQIIKSFAVGNYDRMTQLITYAIKYSFLFIGVLTIVLSFEMDWILNLWLVEVPKYTPWICRIILISFCVTTCSFVLTAGIQATGNIRLQSIIGGSISLFGILPCTYLLLLQGYSPYSAYICFSVFSIIILMCFMGILKNQVQQVKITDITLKGLIPDVIVLCLTSGIVYLIHSQLKEGVARFILVCGSSVVVACVLTYVFAMGDDERAIVRNYIKRKVFR